MITAKTTSETIIRIQKIISSDPFVEPTITASTISTAVSVMIVPPTVTVTDSSFEIPRLLTIGYEIKVWVENILAIKNDVVIEKSSK